MWELIFTQHLFTVQWGIIPVRDIGKANEQNIKHPTNCKKPWKSFPSQNFYASNITFAQFFFSIFNGGINEFIRAQKPWI